MNKDQILKNAEALVREVLAKDFHQKVSPATVREVALKVSRAIPSTEKQHRRADGSPSTR